MRACFALVDGLRYLARMTIFAMRRTALLVRGFGNSYWVATAFKQDEESGTVS